MLEESLDKPLNNRSQGGSQDDYWPSGEHISTERCQQHEEGVFKNKLKTLETSREQLLQQLQQTTKRLDGLKDGKRQKENITTLMQRKAQGSGLAWGPTGSGARMEVSASPPMDGDARYKTDRSQATRNAASIFQLENNRDHYNQSHALLMNNSVTTDEKDLAAGRFSSLDPMGLGMNIGSVLGTRAQS